MFSRTGISYISNQHWNSMIYLSHIGPVLYHHHKCVIPPFTHLKVKIHLKVKALFFSSFSVSFMERLWGRHWSSMYKCSQRNVFLQFSFCSSPPPLGSPNILFTNSEILRQFQYKQENIPSYIDTNLSNIILGSDNCSKLFYSHFLFQLSLTRK